MKKRLVKPGENYLVEHLVPFACFACRKSFKRPQSWNSLHRKCPHCGGAAIMLDQKFKAPRTSDLKQWRKVQALVEAGFRFGTVSRHEYKGAYSYAKYPEKLSEVAAF